MWLLNYAHSASAKSLAIRFQTHWIRCFPLPHAAGYLALCDARNPSPFLSIICTTTWRQIRCKRRCHLLYVTKEKTEHPKTASRPRVLSFWMDAHRSYCLNCAANSFIKKWEVAFRLSADSGNIGTRIWKFCYALKKLTCSSWIVVSKKKSSTLTLPVVTGFRSMWIVWHCFGNPALCSLSVRTCQAWVVFVFTAWLWYECPKWSSNRIMISSTVCTHAPNALQAGPWESEWKTLCKMHPTLSRRSWSSSAKIPAACPVSSHIQIRY